MKEKKSTGERVITTLCASHCGGGCLLKAHVKDGLITRIETDDGEEPQLRACWRGRAYRQIVYASDRILYPLKRTGERGEAKFQRISWDEALDTIASEIKRVRNTCGPLSVIYMRMSGDLVCLNLGTVRRVLALTGGFTATWGSPSFHGGLFASFYSYGTLCASNSRDDLLNSRLIIMWSWDPATTILGPNTSWYLRRAREQGTRIIFVDPQFSDSAANLADEWIPIIPGTDAAMLVAMAYVMIQENLHNQRFLNKYTVGFEKFRDYVLGKEDGVAKTPGWAEAITGVPAPVITQLAREYATTRPAALMTGNAAGRTAFGEQYHRCAIALAAMAGNIGIHGGDAGARAWESIVGGYPHPIATGGAFPFVKNPAEDNPPSDSLWYKFHHVYPRIHYTKVADAILKGKASGYPSDYKMVFMDNTNYLNSIPNINKVVKALNSLEFIVTMEQFMNPTARFADIVLPTTTFMEREDIAPGVGTPYYGFQNKIIEPLGECKPQREIARELAARMGIPNFDEQSEEEHLRELAKTVGIKDYDSFKKEGTYHLKFSEPYLAFKAQIEDPDHNPFPTPSGKIEIYSQLIADMGNPLIPPIPKYIETWENRNDPMFQKYPIQLLTNHAKRRALAKWDNTPWLRELVAQEITMNAADARARGIRNGAMVRVFNDRGETRVLAHVTNRIMPGVAILPSGAWYEPDEQGIDHGGSANVLTRDEPSPGGAFAHNTLLVQIEKV